MKKYYTYTVKRLITVQHLVTIEYLQMNKGFSYPEESHDFYEMVYVESGSVRCDVKNECVELSRGDLFLISPNNSHAYFVEKNRASVLILCFKSKSNIIFSINGLHKAEDNIKSLIDEILDEARATFVFPFDEKLTLNSHPRLGSQQLIENYIEEVLIKLVQGETYKEDGIRIVANTADIKETLSREIVKLLKDNIYSTIKLSEVCKKMIYSKTYLNDIFKATKGTTIMQYYNDLKLAEAKKLLEKNDNITTVAEKLCFESPQHFAKVFKKKTGLTPSEYRKKTSPATAGLGKD